MKPHFPSHVQQILESFERETEIDLDFSDTDTACLLVDGEVSIHLRYHEESDSFEFYGLLPCLAQEAFAAAALDMMNANFLWAGTGGATLGRDQESGRCALCMRIPAAQGSNEALIAVLTTLGENVDFWRRRLAEYVVDDTGSDPLQSPTSAVSNVDADHQFLPSQRA